MTTGRQRSQIDRLIEEASTLTSQGRDVRGVAAALAREMPVALLRRLAAQLIVDRVRSHERHLTLVAERHAEREDIRAQVLHEMTTSAPPPGRRWRPTPQEQAERAAIDSEHRDRMLVEILGIVNDYSSALKIEWTAELLGREFALADGSTVTWGQATAEQHSERLRMFTRNAAANIEGAARHQKALDALAASGADSLEQMLAAA